MGWNQPDCVVWSQLPGNWVDRLVAGRRRSTGVPACLDPSHRRFGIDVLAQVGGEYFPLDRNA